jgi:D-3-phosphoglycerate dehydrogenase / 2-oxoglutarate reductase
LSFLTILILLDNTREELQKYYEIIDYSDTQLYITPEEFIKRSADADVIVNNFACQLDEKAISQLKKTQYMNLSTHMYKYVDIQALKNSHIHMSHLPYEYKSVAVAEYVLAQTFALLRSTSQASEQVKTGVNEFRYFVGEQLRGKKVIVFGAEIGTKDVVDLFRGLGVEVAIYAESSHYTPDYYGLSHFATIEEVFETGDIFYFSWTGDEYRELVGAIDETFLNMIKRPVYIISVYKHSFIDYQLLRELVYKGLIKGLAFDSFPEISNDQSGDVRRLICLPNVIITPDIGWYTRDSIKNMNDYVVKQLVAYAKGNFELLMF